MSSKDEMLAMFVSAVNKHEYSLDITLNVNGSLVTGSTISAHHYFESLAESFEGGEEVAATLNDEISNASDSAKEQAQNDANFIHLKNTQVYTGDAQPTPSKGQFLWRGKMEEVDGFFLGRISSEK